MSDEQDKQRENGPNSLDKRYHFGELNSIKVGRMDGPTLDPGNNNSLGLLSRMAGERANPNAIDPQNFYGTWKAIVLKVDLSCKEVPASYELNIGTQAQVLTTVRARIPELDGYIPDPLQYGTNADSLDLEIVNSHRLFVAENANSPVPAVGDIIWVEVTDIDNIDEAGYYRDVVVRSNIDGGAVGTDANSTKDKFGNVGGLGIDPATGDAIGGIGPSGPSGQNPISLETIFADGDRIIYPKIQDEQYAYERGKRIEKVELVNWTNPNGTKRRVVKDAFPYLELLNRFMIANIKVQLYVNSGFRTFEEQKKLRVKFERQKKLQKEGKDFDPKTKKGNPYPAAKAGFSKHQNGTSYDFAIWSKGRRVPLKNSSYVFQWMNINAPKFGFVWGSVKSELHHWDFDADKAPDIKDETSFFGSLVAGATNLISGGEEVDQVPAEELSESEEI